MALWKDVFILDIKWTLNTTLHTTRNTLLFWLQWTIYINRLGKDVKQLNTARHWLNLHRKISVQGNHFPGAVSAAAGIRFRRGSLQFQKIKINVLWMKIRAQHVNTFHLQLQPFKMLRSTSQLYCNIVLRDCFLEVIDWERLNIFTWKLVTVYLQH